MHRNDTIENKKPSLCPPILKPGDCIGVMAPSSIVEETSIKASKALLEEKGYKVFIHPQTYEQKGSSAGTPLQKALALQGLWQRQDIKAIWAAGGGNRALDLIDTINFSKMTRTPKAFIGFSDTTALLNALYAQTGIITYHAPVFHQLHKHKDLDLTLELLAGETKYYDFPSATRLLRKGEGQAQGVLVGGNLSLFQYLPQTLPKNFYKGALLFLEDCNEELSRIDRIFIHLKRLGVFQDISALILGEFTGIKDTGRPFQLSLEEIVLEHTEGLDIPILLNAPFGHGENLIPFPIGNESHLSTSPLRLILKK